MSPRYTSAAAVGVTELETDSAEREKYGLAVAQVVTAVAGALKTQDGDLFDTRGFDDLEVCVLLYSKSGSPTSVDVTALEAATNEASASTAVAGAQLSFTGSDISAGKAAAFRVRWVGRKRYFGVQVLVTGGTSVGVALLARGVNARVTASASAPSSVVTAVTLA